MAIFRERQDAPKFHMMLRQDMGGGTGNGHLLRPPTASEAMAALRNLPPHTKFGFFKLDDPQVVIRAVRISSVSVRNGIIGTRVHYEDGRSRELSTDEEKDLTEALHRKSTNWIGMEIIEVGYCTSSKYSTIPIHSPAKVMSAITGLQYESNMAEIDSKQKGSPGHDGLVGIQRSLPTQEAEDFGRIRLHFSQMERKVDIDTIMRLVDVGLDLIRLQLGDTARSDVIQSIEKIAASTPGEAFRVFLSLMEVAGFQDTELTEKLIAYIKDGRIELVLDIGGAAQGGASPSSLRRKLGMTD